MEVKDLYNKYIMRDIFGYLIPGFFVLSIIYLDCILFNFEISKPINVLSDNTPVSYVVQFAIIIFSSFFIGRSLLVFTSKISALKFSYHLKLILLGKSKKYLELDLISAKNKLFTYINKLSIFDENISEDISKIDETKVKTIAVVLSNSLYKYPEYQQNKLLRSQSISSFNESMFAASLLSSILLLPLIFTAEVNLLIRPLPVIFDIFIVIFLLFLSFIFYKQAVRTTKKRVNEYLVSFIEYYSSQQETVRNE